MTGETWGERDWARSLAISKQVACDVRRGRRPISDVLLERMIAAQPQAAGDWTVLK